jgi:hypothetical protein
MGLSFRNDFYKTNIVKKIKNYFRNKNSVKTLLFFSVFILLFVSACSDDESELSKEGGPFEISELAGNWEATAAFFTNNSSNVSLDIVAEGGSLLLSVQSNGKCTFTIDPVDRDAYSVSGDMFWEKFEGEYFFSIVFDDFPGDWSSFGATLTATTFIMNGGPDSGEYDFDNDGTPESASLGFQFIRN